jgi:pimeloyl-ACP methyl ester carboxylesterase
MHQAGIAPTDPVLLAGHSQGGIEAAWIAGHTEDFSITQVVTAGSPVAGMTLPATTQMLSLEHHGDVMPLLDGEDNGEAVNHVTVGFGFDDHTLDLADNHAMAHYVGGAADVDASTHPSLVAAVAGLHDDGFLTGETAEVTYQAFQITRTPR